MNVASKQQATVWKEVKATKNCVTRVISTFEGKDPEGTAIYSQWLARFVGEAFKPAKKLEEKDRIIIRKGKIENQYDEKTKKSTAVVIVFDFIEDDEDE